MGHEEVKKVEFDSSHVVYHSVGNFIPNKIKIEESFYLPLIAVSGFVFKRISKGVQVGSKSQI